MTTHVTLTKNSKPEPIIYRRLLTPPSPNLEKQQKQTGYLDESRGRGGLCGVGGGSVCVDTGPKVARTIARRLQPGRKGF